MRLLPSYTWTTEIITAALELEKEHAPSYDVVDWVSAAVFANYTDQIKYSALHNANSHGERLDMTNWATLYLPKAVLPHINLGIIGLHVLAALVHHTQSCAFIAHFLSLLILPLCALA
eukprot:2018071-Pleurochrysis_carterae.AAC.1